jgi:hypothetical protein
MGHVYTWRRILTKCKLTGFREIKLNHISLYINMLSDDYLEVQELRQKMLQAVLVLLDILRRFYLSDPKTVMLSCYLKNCTKFVKLSINGIDPCRVLLFCGQINF